MRTLGLYLPLNEEDLTDEYWYAIRQYIKIDDPETEYHAIRIDLDKELTIKVEKLTHPPKRKKKTNE